MEPRTLARLQALGRVAIGAVLMARPGPAGTAWLGEAGARPGTRVVVAAVGARDLALGAGAAWALGAGADARAWLCAGVLADSIDLVATVRARDSLPAPAVAGVGILAGGSAVLGLWLLSALD